MHIPFSTQHAKAMLCLYSSSQQPTVSPAVNAQFQAMHKRVHTQTSLYDPRSPRQYSLSQACHPKNAFEYSQPDPSLSSGTEFGQPEHVSGDCKPMAAACQPSNNTNSTNVGHYNHTDNDTRATQAPMSDSQLLGLIKMARPNSIPMAAGLVAFGAFGARHCAPLPIDPLTQKRLALSTVLTIMVTSSSMLINDYFDWKSGVDNPETKPNRPLVTGQVKPETLVTALKATYATHLALLCLVDSTPTRLWILGNTLLTQGYSEHLKPITGVKNATCAAIVSMAVGLGALAIGGNTKALLSVWRPMAVVAGTICHREMIMDIKDASGDAQTGVRTVPVVLGKKRAFIMSMVPLLLAALAASTTAGKLAKFTATSALIGQGICALDARAKRFSPATMSRAIELAPAWLLAALIALTQ